MTDEERMEWEDLRTLLKMTTVYPGRLVFADTNEPLTPEGLLKEHEAEFPQARAWYAEFLRRYKN